MRFLVFAILCGLLATPLCAQENIDAAQLIKKAIDYYRGDTSIGVMEMTVNRPRWKRSTKIKVWTRGSDESLVRVLAPKKDAGAGNLLKDDDMWTFTPKINRVIKLPSSMMNQSWMGSDFSNNDIAKSDDIVDRYNHKLLEVKKEQGHTIYIIEAKPKEDAAVVWGKEIVHIREKAYILLRHEFYDQENKLVRVLESKEIKHMGGRDVVSLQRMSQIERKNEWTEVKLHEIEFGKKMPNYIFTLSNLRNPRN